MCGANIHGQFSSSYTTNKFPHEASIAQMYVSASAARWVAFLGLTIMHQTAASRYDMVLRLNFSHLRYFRLYLYNYRTAFSALRYLLCWSDAIIKGAFPIVASAFNVLVLQLARLSLSAPTLEGLRTFYVLHRPC